MAHVYARPHHMLQTEEEVLDIVEDDPSTSTREIARQVNVSQHKMGGLECVITGLMDEFPNFFHHRKHAREIFTLGIILMSFAVALINVTPGGIYMFHLFDTYSAGISLLCSALFEAIAVSWFYGLDRFTQDVEAMLGLKPGIYWRICWKFISPSFIVCVVMFGLFYHQPLQYNDYYYPGWAEWVGWGLALSSIVMIPVVAIIQIMKIKGSCRETSAEHFTDRRARRNQKK
ncbi:hypothetical protein NQ317_008823 [Molorchus minor]|uniref:Uncharacterized protein n=1 Tax=Molorchus minor TaxID=1323400 RepID=A0ABQ9JUB7_9CUCU|nr:hypothetical protein NQ317_008823 [Molorchus minor]